MKINELRGAVADRPIDARVVRDDGYSHPTMGKIMAAHPDVQRVDVSKLPDYDKG